MTVLEVREYEAWPRGEYRRVVVVLLLPAGARRNKGHQLLRAEAFVVVGQAW